MQATINNVQMSWREAGSGDPVIFLHAFPLHSGMWEPQLEALPAGWRGIAPDFRGFGRSAPGSYPYSMEKFADDVFALADHLELEHVVLCGLSMGGYVAFSAMRKYASRVRGLILCDTRAAADTAEAKQGRKELAAKVRKEGARAAITAMLSKLTSDQTREANPDITGEIQQLIMSNAPETIARAIEALAERRSSEDLFASINCPVLVIHGTDDAIIPTGDAQMMARAIRGAQLQLIQEAGHLSNMEQPAMFNRLVGDFLHNLPPYFAPLDFGLKRAD